MQKNLVIVESPAKAKTIEKFLGTDFKVMSSYGHIRDLKKKNFGVDLETFEPQYEIPTDKKRVVSELRQQAKKSEAVWLASDEDREGEAISWHLAEVLGLDPNTTRRIVFHEITKPAILASTKRAMSLTAFLTSSMPNSADVCSTDWSVSNSHPCCGAVYVLLSLPDACRA